MGSPNQKFIGTTTGNAPAGQMTPPIRHSVFQNGNLTSKLVPAFMALTLMGLTGGLIGCGQKGDLYLPTTQSSKPPITEEEDKRSPQKGSSKAEQAEAASGV